MATTTTKGYPYPEGSDANDVPGDMQALAEACDDSPGITSLTSAEIAALSAGMKWAGRVVWNSTTSKLQVSNGSSFSDVILDLSAYATLASPTFTGTLTAADITLTGVLRETVTRNAQSGTSYTLVLADRGKLVELGNANPITLTIPANASVAFPVGTKIDLLQTGAGQVTVSPAGGVTVNAKTGLKTSGQWAAATLVKRATDTWVLIGSLSA